MVLLQQSNVDNNKEVFMINQVGFITSYNTHQLVNILFQLILLKEEFLTL